MKHVAIEVFVSRNSWHDSVGVSGSNANSRGQIKPDDQGITRASDNEPSMPQFVMGNGETS